jgi:hypothetical protein
MYKKGFSLEKIIDITGIPEEDLKKAGAINPRSGLSAIVS